ncbi:flavodoxin domain-containing protein [Bacillus alkalicellulosilyticus]|uniref:flavodoxin domain-containing protein n=1 Tax=Alkalihalobacterium alkalicellulosilyticum TaxID=1912214 RepID=UPI0009974144|nr:flavodoxin domain-containing protein [Bacillus alkalicellulosilyticus]
MGLMNYKIAIVYTSVTGNTEEVTKHLYSLFLRKGITVDCYTILSFPLERLQHYDALVIGTYTWGNGNIPKEMLPLYRAIETNNSKGLVTGVYGTGDRFYPHFCGAVDEFRDMLFVQTTLAVTIRIELAPQQKDFTRLQAFTDTLLKRVMTQKTA